ncbi:MAG: aminotransferase class V-fold PLP-dependent enzyme [Planctomycetota bacterium]|nr:aminotransferase class V-fold PLP-dependent enzyme [Planctomycetota bacterium]MDA1177646.1 aminotransferase class V-fold PLP-dependent enzyme [Planctomycetota bacterium]
MDMPDYNAPLLAHVPLTTRERFRAAMPITRKWAYFDQAAVSPLPEPTRAAVELWLREATEEGDTAWPRWNRELERCRGLAAGIIGATPAEIALIPNTTTGISIVAEGFPWQSGDNLVTLENEFPSNIYPWMHLQQRGVELRRVPVLEGRPDRNKLRAACDRHTKIVSLSWVGYASGWRWDISQAVELAHQCGALLMLDAIQGLGVHPIDVRASGVDFLAADGHKWLLGPEGAGVFYVRSEHLERLRPPQVGWNSMEHRYDFSRLEWKLRADASRFEGGTYNMAGFLGFAASLQLLADLGLGPQASPIESSVLAFRESAIEVLRQRGAEILSPTVPAIHQSGIFCFSIPNVSPEQVRRVFHDHGVVVSCRGGGIRLSAHGYANEQDLQRLEEAMERVRHS